MCELQDQAATLGSKSVSNSCQAHHGTRFTARRHQCSQACQHTNFEWDWVYDLLHMTSHLRGWVFAVFDCSLLLRATLQEVLGLQSVSPTLAELWWPAGAEGPSGARAHLAAVLGHDAEKLAQWLFASMAGPQVRTCCTHCMGSRASQRLQAVGQSVPTNCEVQRSGATFCLDEAVGVTRSLTGRITSACDRWTSALRATFAGGLC